MASMNECVSAAALQAVFDGLFAEQSRLLGGPALPPYHALNVEVWPYLGDELVERYGLAVPG